MPDSYTKHNPGPQFYAQPHPEGARRTGRNERGSCEVTYPYFSSKKSLNVFCVRSVTELVKRTTSFKSIRSDHRGKVHGRVIQGIEMRIYADSLHCYGVGKKKKTSLIYLQSPRYCAQSHEMPVRGREYLGGPGIRQRMVGKTQHFIFLKGERSRGSRPANSICVSTPQFRALGRHS